MRDDFKYSAVTKDGTFIQSDSLESFKLEDLTMFMVTEKLSSREVIKLFEREYPLPDNMKRYILSTGKA